MNSIHVILLLGIFTTIPMEGESCEVGEEKCLGSCYNPKEKLCFGQYLCDLGQLECGGKCYDPADTSKVCLGAGNANGISALCDKGQKLCGRECYTGWHGSCYRSRIGGGEMVCNHGFILCRLEGFVVG